MIRGGFKRPNCSDSPGLVPSCKKTAKFTDVDCKQLCGFSAEDLLDAVSPRDAKLLQGDVSDVDVLLARWWRRRSRDGQTVQSSISTVISPRTRIRCISRSTEAKKFLAYCVIHLNSLLSEQDSENDFSTYCTLGGCLSRLGHYSEALEKIKKALEIRQEAKALWFCRLVEKQIKFDHDRELRLSSTSLVSSKLPVPVPVERRSVDDLSLQEFFTSYASAHVPVIITGLVGHMTKIPWTIDYVKLAIGSQVAPLKRHVQDSAEWAKLEPADTCTVEEFISSLTKEGETRYLFDWSLPLYAPELAQELTIPKYFANDFLQRTGTDSMYYNSWPSLFIAPKDVFSAMHIDAFGSNFWMALFQGRKRWTFFSPEDTCCLYPRVDSTMDPTFDTDFTESNLADYPALAFVTPRECILCPGEILFVPAGCPHRVENLEESLAISANFVDSSNFELVQQELQINGLIDERAAELYEILSNKQFNSQMDFTTSHLEWNKFKQKLTQ